MEHVYSYGSDIIVVSTCAPGAGPMQIGIGDDLEEARADLESTAVEGHLSPLAGLRWAAAAGWLGTGDADEIYEEIEDYED